MGCAGIQQPCGRIMCIADAEHGRLPAVINGQRLWITAGKSIPLRRGNQHRRHAGDGMQRKDDDPETVRDRLAVYHKETEPLKGFYEARGILKTVEDQSTVDGTTQAILAALGR